MVDFALYLHLHFFIPGDSERFGLLIFYAFVPIHSIIYKSQNNNNNNNNKKGVASYTYVLMP